jgi:hypothetical protein
MYIYAKNWLKPPTITIFHELNMVNMRSLEITNQSCRLAEAITAAADNQHNGHF